MVDFLDEHPVIGMTIRGFADPHECKSAGCERLSIRRARSAMNWLLVHGVRREQLRGPASEDPNSTYIAPDIRFNMRVNFAPFVLKQ
jgi:hypothetical protein